MKQQITFRQYRAMDLFIFTALLGIGEMLITLGATRWFPQELWTLSLGPAITAIVMVRWGGLAAIPAALGALSFCIASGANPAQYLIYIGGSLLPLVWCLWLKKRWQKLRAQVLLALFYGASVALMMQLGRAVLALLLGHPLAAALPFFTTDALSTLFAALIVWIARRLDGMLEEQKHYLRRVAEEQEKERQAQVKDPWQ